MPSVTECVRDGGEVCQSVRMSSLSEDEPEMEDLRDAVGERW